MVSPSALSDFLPGLPTGGTHLESPGLGQGWSWGAHEVSRGRHLRVVWLSGLRAQSPLASSSPSLGGVCDEGVQSRLLRWPATGTEGTGGLSGRPPTIALPVPGPRGSLTWKGCPSLDVPGVGHVFALRSAGGASVSCAGWESSCSPSGDTGGGRQVRAPADTPRLCGLRAGRRPASSRPPGAERALVRSPPHSSPRAPAPAASAVLCH